MAGSDVEYEMRGIEQALAKMEQLEQLPRKKATRFALRKAANIVRDNAKQRAKRLDDPRTSENIAKNIAVRADTKHLRMKGELKVSVGVRGGASGVAAAVGELRGRGRANPGGDTFYWRFLEFGTENMAARPFMRPAMSESIQPSTAEFTKQMDKAIDRALRRAARGR